MKDFTKDELINLLSIVKHTKDNITLDMSEQFDIEGLEKKLTYMLFYKPAMDKVESLTEDQLIERERVSTDVINKDSTIL